MPAGTTATNPYPSNSQPPLSPAPAPDPPLPAASPGRPPPAASHEGSVGASLVSVDSDDSQLRWLGVALPSVDACSVQCSPARPTRVDCGQGRVEATVDMGNGLTLYDARNVSCEDTRGVVQYVSCGVVFPHRVLICPRDGCGRHAARPSGDLNHAELYCCVPCAQLEGHSDRCDRAYSSHTSLGGPSGTSPVDDTYSHGLDLAICGFKPNGDDSGPTAQVSGSPVVIPPDDVPAASTSSITSPATLATGSSTHVVSPDVNHICRISVASGLPPTLSTVTTLCVVTHALAPTDASTLLSVTLLTMS